MFSNSITNELVVILYKFSLKININFYIIFNYIVVIINNNLHEMIKYKHF